MPSLAALFRYFAALRTAKLVLWCYLIWYLVTVCYYFDPSSALWLNSLGISAVIGCALMLSVGAAAHADRWQVFRLFLMPFCVSSFSSLIKNHGFILIIPPRTDQLLVALGGCAGFIAIVMLLRYIAGPRGGRTARAD